MTKMIQIRNVPDDVHRVLKVRAAQQGTSLSEYLLREVLLHASRPTLEDWLARVAEKEPVIGVPPAEDVVREIRDGR